MTYMEHAQQLRASTTPHYNCFQSVVVPFAKDMGLTEEQAYAMGAHFGSGMRHGGTCGALSGALLVLGSLGYDAPTASALIHSFREKNGATDCTSLLKAARDRGEAPGVHCSDLVYQMVELLAEKAAK